MSSHSATAPSEHEGNQDPEGVANARVCRLLNAIGGFETRLLEVVRAEPESCCESHHLERASATARQITQWRAALDAIIECNPEVRLMRLKTFEYGLMSTFFRLRKLGAVRVPCTA